MSQHWILVSGFLVCDCFLSLSMCFLASGLYVSHHGRACLLCLTLCAFYNVCICHLHTRTATWFLPFSL